MVLNSLFRNYEKFLQKLDGTLSAIRGKAGAAMVCRKGCDACCRAISVFSVEAFYLSGFLAKLSEKERIFILERVSESTGNEVCPFLSDGSCLVYEARPVICRTHGFPLVVTEEGESFLDFCPMNFSGEENLAVSLAINLETLNRTLSAIHGLFMRENSFPGHIPERFSMKEAVSLTFEKKIPPLAGP